MKEIYFLIVYVIFHYYNVNSLKKEASRYYDNRVEQKKIKQKIYDISYKYLPNLERYEYLSDIVTISIIMPVIFYPKIFKEYIGFWVVIFLIRSITIRLTVLPKSNNCENNNYINLGTCYEKIFSGHFASAFLATILYYKYNIIDIKTLTLLNIINSCLIILTRHHYTIDIIVAFFITLCVYQNNISINRF